jgi:hypothetical protein
MEGTPISSADFTRENDPEQVMKGWGKGFQFVLEYYT